MTPVSKDISVILESVLTLDLSLGVNLFIGTEPAEIAECVTLYDIPGAFPSVSLSNEEYKYEAFQVRIRGAEYLRTYERACDIREALKNKDNAMHNGNFYTIIKCVTLPYHLGRDTKNRQIFIINFETQRR